MLSQHVDSEILDNGGHSSYEHPSLFPRVKNFYTALSWEFERVYLNVMVENVTGGKSRRNLMSCTNIAHFTWWPQNYKIKIPGHSRTFQDILGTIPGQQVADLQDNSTTFGKIIFFPRQNSQIPG